MLLEAEDLAEHVSRLFRGMADRNRRSGVTQGLLKFRFYLLWLVGGDLAILVERFKRLEAHEGPSFWLTLGLHPRVSVCR